MVILALNGAVAALIVVAVVAVIVLAWFLLGPPRARDRRDRPSPPTQ